MATRFARSSSLKSQVPCNRPLRGCGRARRRGCRCARRCVRGREAGRKQMFPRLRLPPVIAEELPQTEYLAEREAFAIRRPQRDSYPRLQHAEGDRSRGFRTRRRKRSNPNLCRYGFWHLIGFPQRRKAIRHSASAWTQTSRSSIAIAVRGYACNEGAFERRQHYRRRRKANSSPAIAFGTLRIRRATLRLCNLVAQSSKTCMRSRHENDSPQSRTPAP